MQEKVENVEQGLCLSQHIVATIGEKAKKNLRPRKAVPSYHEVWGGGHNLKIFSKNDFSARMIFHKGLNVQSHTTRVWYANAGQNSGCMHGACACT